MGEGFWARVFLVGTVYLDFTCKVRRNEAQWIWSQCITCVCGFAPLEASRVQSHTGRGCIPWLLTAESIPWVSGKSTNSALYSNMILCSGDCRIAGLTCPLVGPGHLSLAPPGMEEFKRRWFVTFPVLQHWVSICFTPVKECILVLPQWI